jgi:WD40 repeat protein
MFSRFLALACALGAPSAGAAQEPAKALPEGAIARLGDTRGFLPEGGASVLALSPDGKLIAVGSRPVTVRKADTREVVATMEDPKDWRPNILTWSSDGKLLAGVGATGVVCWDVATGKPRWNGGPRGVGSYVTAMRFADGDRKLAVVSTENEPHYTTGEFPTTAKALRGAGDFGRWHVAYLDVAKGEFPEGRPTVEGTTDVRYRRAHLDALGKGYVFSWVTLSPGGTQVAFLASRPSDEADGASAVFVYDTATHKLLHTVKNVPRTYRIDLPDEGEAVVVYPPRPARAAVEKTVVASFTVVSTADGRTRMTGEYRYRPSIAMSGYDTHGMRVFPAKSAVRFRGALLTFDGLGLVRWDADTGRKLEELPLDPFVGSHRFAISADGKRIALGSGTRFRVSGEKLADLREPELSDLPTIQFLPDGRLRTATNMDKWAVHGREVRIWDVKKGAVVESLRLHPWPHGIYREESGRANGPSTVVTGIDPDAGGFVAYDLVKLEPLFTLKPEGLAAKDALQKGYRLIPSNDGSRLLKTVRVNNDLATRWYDRDGKELGRFDSWQSHREGEPEWLDDDGSSFGFVTFDERFAVVDCATKKMMLLGNTSRESWEYEAAGFGRLILGKSQTQKVERFVVWDRQGRTLRNFSLPAARETVTRWTHLSPDSRTLAVWEIIEKGKGDRVPAVRLYETATGKLRGAVPINRDSYLWGMNLDFSPDGRLLATGMKDTSVLLWDIAKPLGKAALAAPKNADDAERLWEVLGDPDPAEADRALWALVAAPDHALRLANEYLIPAVHPEPKRLQPLIANLGAGTLKERDAAGKELLGIGEAALPALRGALREPKSDDQRRRLEALVAQLQPRLEFPGAVAFNLRELRALEVLERIGTAGAKKAVEALATGDTSLLIPREAKLILARWK